MNDATRSGFADRLHKFQNLMARRVRRILLVASSYDYFILEEDGQLDELILNEFTDVSLRNAPGMTRVPTGRDALAELHRHPYDLVITTGHLGDMPLSEFTEAARATAPDATLALLSFDIRAITGSTTAALPPGVDHGFVWLGDYRILFAMVKLVEDRWNVDADVEEVGVGVILLIEDNVHYASAFLPLFYHELMTQSQRVIGEGMNLTHKVVRMRARPKLLFSRTYEDALADYRRHKGNLLGIISDVDFPRGGHRDPEAGVEFARMVRRENPDLPIMLQTHDLDYAAKAREVGAETVHKDSPTLLLSIRQFMLDNFGFGDFVFKLPDGTEVGRARNLVELERRVGEVPPESILYHAERNHFSTWLKARTEFDIARRLRPIRAQEFVSPEAIREYLVRELRTFRHDQRSAAITTFDAETFDHREGFAKIGTGSLGGKARGLAFLRQILYDHGVRHRIEGVRITVPAALVLTTEVFDRFLDTNELRDFALREEDDAVILRRFTEAHFPRRARARIKRFMEKADYPLAVRSSSLLEDSQYQPFAGIYDTVLIPNNEEDERDRRRNLINAIKRVYASTFSRRAKEYMRTTAFRADEEKMAVIVQRLVGAPHGDRFYPQFAGVAQSHNFYPAPPMKPGDGIVAVALGLGRQVVGGGRAVRFCPRYPRHRPGGESPETLLEEGQNTFHALSLSADGEDRVRTYTLAEAAEDGTLDAVASVYDHANHAVHDGLGRPGAPVVTFAPILKHGRFPLAETLRILLDVGRRGMNHPVALEFAACLEPDEEGDRVFAVVQLRPLILGQERPVPIPETRSASGVLCWSSHVLGNGLVEGLRDVVVVDRDRFDRRNSVTVAAAVVEAVARLRAEARPFVLVGVGRWGASDPWLGIPVSWPQITGARVIVEASFRDLVVAPSQGSHFFHNLTAASVGYFTVGEEDRLDWEWLAEQPAEWERDGVRILHLEHPLTVKMAGDEGKGVILR